MLYDVLHSFFGCPYMETKVMGRARAPAALAVFAFLGVVQAHALEALQPSSAASETLDQAAVPPAGPSVAAPAQPEKAPALNEITLPDAPTAALAITAADRLPGLLAE